MGVKKSEGGEVGVLFRREDWTFSWIGLGAAREGRSEGFGRRAGVVSLPSACWVEDAGDAGLPRR